MPALVAQGLRKAFGSEAVLEDLTFTLVRGEKVGLIGANGAGKSTLARILAGAETPDTGTLSVRRGLSVRYLAQEPDLDASKSALAVVEDALVLWRAATSRHAEVTAQLAVASEETPALLAEQAALDDAIVRLGGYSREHEALGRLHRLGVRDVYAPCGERSGGERRRIALAQLLVASPDIAIVDEPTNHLDVDTAAWLEEYFANEFRGALVLVTHDRYFLDSVATRIVELERGRLTSYPGNYGDYLEKKAELLEHEERVEQNRQNMLRREREWLARGPKARATKQKARIARAVALEAETPATAGRPDQATLMSAATSRQGKTILEVAGLTLAAPGSLRPLNAPFDLIVGSGDRIGIVGPNGVGKTTFMRAILAAVEEAAGATWPTEVPRPLTGTIVVGKNTRVAYLDQARAQLEDEKSIFDDVRGATGSTVVSLGLRGNETMDLRSYLELFLFSPQKQRQKVGSLSGGERARVALAKVLRQGANLLLFDEPTNDLDLPTLGALESLLEAYTGSVLVVTHDRAFLDHVATAILAFEIEADEAVDDSVARRAVVVRHAGGYEDYASYKRARASEQPAKAPLPAQASTAPSKGKPSKPRGALTYAERIELEGIVDAIESAERHVAELEALLADPTLYASRGHEVAAIQERLRGSKAGAEKLVLRWEALEAKKG